jgi:hypothetical protein
VPLKFTPESTNKIDIDSYEMPPREIKINNNLDSSYYFRVERNGSSEMLKHIFMKDSRGDLLGHLIPNAISFEDSLRIVEAIFDLSIERDKRELSSGERGSNAFPGFALGHQSAKRSRMPVLINEFKEKERFLRLTEENLNHIRKSDPLYALGFIPNTIIAFLASPGATLGVHVNEKSKYPTVVSFNFGCTVRFNLENRSKSKKEVLYDSDIEHSKCSFNFKSQDFLTFNGRKTHHGIQKCYL